MNVISIKEHEIRIEPVTNGEDSREQEYINELFGSCESDKNPEKIPGNRAPAFGGALEKSGSVLFYVLKICLAVFIIAAVTSNPDRSIFGYLFYCMKTPSMEPELPVGSLVITKAAPPEDINVGDDITVYAGDGVYVTHRVVGITSDITGGLVFHTKGVANPFGDPKPYGEEYVVGKVVRHFPAAGYIFKFLQSYMLFAVIIFAFVLHRVYSRAGLRRNGVTDS